MIEWTNTGNSSLHRFQVEANNNAHGPTFLIVPKKLEGEKNVLCAFRAIKHVKHEGVSGLKIV